MRARVPPLLLVGALCLAGCRTMQRSLTIESTPPGARIWVNGAEQKSPTPVTLPFTWYGWFEVRLEKEGYESVAREIHVETRPDGLPVADLALGFTARDYHHRVHVEMRPLGSEASQAAAEAIAGRARAFRRRMESALREPDLPERGPR